MKHRPMTEKEPKQQAADWKRKAIERREEMKGMKVRLSKLEEVIIYLQKEKATHREEIDSLKRKLEASNQSLEKLKIENQEFKKKVRS